MGNRPPRDDAKWVDVGLTLKVESLYAGKIGRVFESRMIPVQVLHPTIDQRVAIANGANVALVVDEIDRIKPNHTCEQPDVCLG